MREAALAPLPAIAGSAVVARGDPVCPARLRRRAVAGQTAEAAVKISFASLDPLVMCSRVQSAASQPRWICRWQILLYLLRSSEKKASFCVLSPEMRRMARCVACCPPLLWPTRPFGLSSWSPRPFPLEGVRPR